MALSPRDVVRLWDRHTNPNKVKRHICICPERQVFLRIKTRRIWSPYHFLRASECNFLDHDSYVELQQLLRHLAYEIQRAELIGSLSDAEASALCVSVRSAKTFSEEHKRLICDKLMPEADEDLPF